MSPLWKVGDKWLNVTQVAVLMCISRAAVTALLTRPFDPLPKPFPFGNTRRWLASDVWTWMERQMAREADATSLEESSVQGSDEVLNPAPHAVVDSLDARRIWLMELKSAYEAGMTLEELCQREKKGKAGMSALLREAGAEMRRPGRRASHPSRTVAAAPHIWRGHQ